jgi:starch synthase
MRILSVASEVYPLIKTGGLADVAGALPLALAAHGIEIKTLLPAYPGVIDRLHPRANYGGISDLFGGPARLISGRTEGGAEILALHAPHLYERAGGPYLAPDGRDWPDNARRFAALAWAGRELALGHLGPWTPELVHAHDWQAGLVPAYLALSGPARPATVMTIHNIAFQGLFARELLPELHLPPACFTLDGVEFHGQIGFLKAGLAYADRLTTVSPTYAREIQGPEHGHGLEGMLRHRADVLTGILNGIDDAAWDPARDALLTERYDSEHLGDKARNTAVLRRRLGLEAKPRAPLFCVVSRLTQAKGIDLALQAVPAILAGGGQLAILGAGDAALESAARAVAAAHPGQVAAVIGYDEPLAHLFQAGSDAILVPSRTEPCGLTQLYGLRYGTLPIVARVGGLADSVIDANHAALSDGVATGLQFAPDSAPAVRDAIARALALYSQPEVWRALQRRGMTRDFGWRGAARHYVSLYQSLVTRRLAA